MCTAKCWGRHIDGLMVDSASLSVALLIGSGLFYAKRATAGLNSTFLLFPMLKLSVFLVK